MAFGRNKNDGAAPTAAPQPSLTEAVGALFERAIGERQMLDQSVTTLEDRLVQTRIERDKTANIEQALDVMLHGGRTEQG